MGDCALKEIKKNDQPGKTIDNSRRDRMLCLYVLEYFFHDFLFWFNSETQVGAIEGLGKPVILVKKVSNNSSEDHFVRQYKLTTHWDSL